MLFVWIILSLWEERNGKKKIKDRKEKGKMSIVEGRRKESGGDREEKMTYSQV